MASRLCRRSSSQAIMSPGRPPVAPSRGRGSGGKDPQRIGTPDFDKRLLFLVPEGPSTQYLRTLVPKTIPLMAFGTRVLKHRVLGPFASVIEQVGG